MTNSTAISEPDQEFQDEVIDHIRHNVDLHAATSIFNKIFNKFKYAYNFEWLADPSFNIPKIWRLSKCNRLTQHKHCRKQILRRHQFQQRL